VTAILDSPHVVRHNEGLFGAVPRMLPKRTSKLPSA